MKRFMIQIDPEDHEFLRAEAFNKNVSISKVARDALKCHIKLAKKAQTWHKEMSGEEQEV